MAEGVAPVGDAAGVLHANGKPGQNQKGNHHSQAIDEAQIPHPPRYFRRLIDKPKNLERDYRQHARHDVENESAQKRQQQYRRQRAWRHGWNHRRGRFDGQIHFHPDRFVRIQLAHQNARNVIGPFGFVRLDNLFQAHDVRAARQSPGRAFHVKIGIGVGIKIRGRGVRFPLDDQGARIALRAKAIPGSAGFPCACARRDFLPPLFQERGVGRWLGFLGDGQCGGDGVAGKDANIRAFHPMRGRLQFKRAGMQVFGQDDGSQEDNPIGINIGDKRRVPGWFGEFGGNGPVDFAGGEARRKLPIDFGWLTGIAAVAPVGVPGRRHVHFQAGPNRIARAR